MAVPVALINEFFQDILFPCFRLRYATLDIRALIVDLSLSYPQLPQSLVIEGALFFQLAILLLPLLGFDYLLLKKQKNCAVFQPIPPIPVPSFFFWRTNSSLFSAA